MVKICWFTTGRDKEAFTLLKDICDAIDNHVIEGEISVLFTNRESGESATSDEIIALAQQKRIPVESLSSKRFLEQKGLKLHEGRAIFDAEVKSRIERYPFDLIFLAGYMLIISPVLFESYPVINVHPSLPGAYKGKWEEVMRDTIADGVRTFGAMIHMVDAVLDEGPPICYVKLELQGEDVDRLYREAARGDQPAKDTLFRIMREREFAVETPLIIAALSLISRDDIRITDKKVYHEGRLVEGGIDISRAILSVQAV